MKQSGLGGCFYPVTMETVLPKDIAQGEDGKAVKNLIDF